MQAFFIYLGLQPLFVNSALLMLLELFPELQDTSISKVDLGFCAPWQSALWGWFDLK
jgi:hypothetical protein